MKMNVFYILMAVLVISLGAMRAECSEPYDTVLRYLQALKGGDVETIKDSITGELLEKRSVLLEENENYSEFLRTYYQGAVFEIKANPIKGNMAQTSVEVYFINRHTQFELLLNMNDKGKWKIFKEVDEQK